MNYINNIHLIARITTFNLNYKQETQTTVCRVSFTLPDDKYEREYESVIKLKSGDGENPYLNVNTIINDVVVKELIKLEDSILKENAGIHKSHHRSQWRTDWCLRCHLGWNHTDIGKECNYDSERTDSGTSTAADLTFAAGDCLKSTLVCGTMTTDGQGYAVTIDVEYTDV